MRNSLSGLELDTLKLEVLVRETKAPDGGQWEGKKVLERTLGLEPVAETCAIGKVGDRPCARIYATNHGCSRDDIPNSDLWLLFLKQAGVSHWDGMQGETTLGLGRSSRLSLQANPLPIRVGTGAWEVAVASDSLQGLLQGHSAVLRRIILGHKADRSFNPGGKEEPGVKSESVKRLRMESIDLPVFRPPACRRVRRA